MPHQKFFHLRGFKYWMPLFIFAFSVLVFFFSLNFDMAEAETIYVDASGNGDYTSIQDAINHASEGDTLIVNLGTYTEQLNVDKPLKIFGNSSDASKIVIDGDSTGDTVIFSSSNIIFHNFTLKNSGNDKALISISGNINSNISNCLFEVNSKGIQFTNSASSHEVYNSTFQGEDKTGTGIEIVDGDNLKIVGSKFTDLDTGIFFNAQGTGVLNQDNTINDCIIKGNRRGIEFFEIEDNENTGTDTTKNSIYKNDEAGIFYNIQKENPPPVDQAKLKTTDCWWGDPSGPYVEDGNEGKGDKIIVQTSQGQGQIMTDCYQPWEEKPRRKPTTFYVDDDASPSWYKEDGHFKYIQDALNESFKNDVVCLYQGTYYENLYMNHSNVKIIGNGSDVVIIDGGEKGNVIEINADYCVVENVTVQNSGDGTGEAGIFINGNNNHVLNSIIKDNKGRGIVIEKDTQNNSLLNLTIENSGNVGLRLEGESHSITNLTIRRCQSTGILMISTGSRKNQIVNCNIIKNNLAQSNPRGGGIVFRDGSDNNIVSNSVIEDNWGTGIFIFDSNSNAIKQTVIKDSTHSGVLFRGSSSSNHITNTTLHNNTYGIYVESGSSANNNEIHSSTISGNSDYGIYVGNSEEFNATYVYWGAADGPSGEGAGNGDKISFYVDFEPFLRKNFSNLQLIYKEKKRIGEKKEYRLVYELWNPHGEDVTWELNTNASFLSFYESNLTVWGKPRHEDIGIYYVNLSVEGSEGGKDYHNFTLEVYELNDPPELDPKYDGDTVQTDEDKEFSLVFTATDEEGDDLSWNWHLGGAESFLSVEENDNKLTLSGTPKDEDVGDYSIQVEVSDAENTTTSTFTLRVLNTPDPVNITTEGSTIKKDLMEEEDYIQDFEAQDPDLDSGDSLSWSIEEGPSFLSIVKISDTKARLSGRAESDDQCGTFQIRVKVEDSTAKKDYRNFTLVVTAVNDAPKILTSPEFTADEDSLYLVVYTAEDEETPSDQLIWDWENSDSADFLHFEKDGNQTLWGTPRNNDVGLYNITIRVRDEGGITASAQFELEVRNVNDPPQITTKSPPTSVSEDTYYEYHFNATDEDSIHGDFLLWYLNTNASWLEINSTTGVLSGTPGDYDPGEYNVNVTVRDSAGSEDSFVFKLEVLNINDPPLVNITSPANKSMVSGTVVIQGTVKDIDSEIQKVEYMIGSGEWKNASGTENWSFSWDTTEVSNDSYILKVRAYDGELYSQVKWLILVVANEENKAPVAVISEILPGQEVFVGEEVTFNGSGSYDEDGSIVRYVWRSSLDGEFYNGTEASFSTSNLSLGTHTIWLKVQDDDGLWSQLAEVTLTVKEKGVNQSDFDLEKNPTPVKLIDGRQSNPSIYGQIVVWRETTKEHNAIFMFNLSSPEKVYQISNNSEEMEKGNESHLQMLPQVYKEDVVWLHQWVDSQQQEYYHLRHYKIGESEKGGEVVFDFGFFPTNGFQFSENRIFWLKPRMKNLLEVVYDLYLYDLTKEKEEKLLTLSWPIYSVYGNEVVYLISELTDILTFKTKLVVYNFESGKERANISLDVEIYKIKSIDFWGDYIVWEDGRKEGDASRGEENTDIYFINLKEKKIGQITTDGSAQRNPSVQGDYILWEDKRNGTFSIYAYSISENKMAVLCENGSELVEPDVYGNWAVWVADAGEWDYTHIYLFNLSKAHWGPSEAILRELDIGGEDGEDGESDESPLPFEIPLIGAFLVGSFLFVCCGLPIIALALAIWNYKDAEARGRSGVAWLLVNLILPIIAAIIWLIVRPKKGVASQGYSKKEEKRRLKEEKKRKKREAKMRKSQEQTMGVPPPQFPTVPQAPSHFPPPSTPQFQQPSPEAGPLPLPNMPPLGEPTTQPGKWLCVNCKKEVEEKFRFCIYCGSARKKG